MEKVKVSREVAEAIEHRREKGYKLKDFMNAYFVSGFIGLGCDALDRLDIETYAKALINGYEVEKTPQEKLLEYINSLSAEQIQVVVNSLSILNIKVSGVNDNELRSNDLASDSKF